MDPGFITARRTATKFEEQLLGRGTECLNRAGTSGRGRGISCWDRHYREGKGYRLRVTAMQLAEVSLPRRAGAQFRRPGSGVADSLAARDERHPGRPGRKQSCRFACPKGARSKACTLAFDDLKIIQKGQNVEGTGIL